MMNYVNLFLSFFKIGAFTFGGGYAMLPLIQQEVAANRWLSDKELINFIAVSESTPGPLAVNMSTYVGMTVGGIVGAICATLGVILPSFITILVVAKFYESFKDNRIVEGCMYGLKPAVVGLIACAVVTIFKTVFNLVDIKLFSLTDIKLWVSLIIFAVSLFFVLKKKVHPIIIICVSAILGIGFGYMFKL